MDNATTNVSDAVIKGEVLEPNTKLTDKEIMDALTKQAKFAEDYYRKQLSQFEENLKKNLQKYLNL
jgi:hypothetical protein